jgi:serine/threonine-protein kinase
MSADPPSELPAAAQARLLADARELAAEGALLHGRYRLVRELGRGGMGVVYEAEDVALRRRVALKRLNLVPGAGPGLAEVVLREARAAARLDHPNIAAVYDVHPDALVMQLVEGRPLSELADVPVRTLVAWTRDAARAVHHAHAHGIVHRDLKPHNLLIAGERVVVTDFGLAKELAVDTSLSLSGSVLGTPAYMPPEQAGGRAREVDARADVYALGATLYDRLAGRPPFASKDLVALLRAVVEDEPVPLRALAPAVPRDLACVVHTCLEKDKARRYASADALADDLERWLAGAPVHARPPSLAYRLEKTLRRHRRLAAGAVLLALVALGAVAWNASERARHAATEETLALVERVNVVLENAQAMGVGEGRQSALELLEGGIADCRAFLARHPSHQIEAKLGRLLSEAGRTDEALAAFERALALRPGDAPARLERGLLRSKLHRERSARAPDDAELAALHAGARADLEVVLAPAPELRVIDIERGKGELARLEGRLADATRHYANVERLAPHLEVPPARAALALARGDPDEAFRQAMSAVDLARGFAPAYVATGATATPEEAAARAIRQLERAAAGLEATLEIEGLAGRFTDWAARLAERTSTAAAYAHRATGELRRAARAEDEGRRSEGLAALARASEDLGYALTIEPALAPAYADRAWVALARAERLGAAQREGEARAALEQARADLARATELGLEVKRAEQLAAALSLHTRGEPRDEEER